MEGGSAPPALLDRETGQCMLFMCNFWGIFWGYMHVQLKRGRAPAVD